MKKYFKLLFIMLAVFVSFISIKAAEITKIDMDYYFLPQAGKTSEMVTSLNYTDLLGRVTNTDKVVLEDIDVFNDEGFRMYDEDTFEEGKEYKIRFGFSTKSINDYITDNTVLTVNTGAGKYTLHRVYLNEWQYSFELKYTVPSEVLATKTVTIYPAGLDNSNYVMYVNDGMTINFPSDYNAIEGKHFLGYEYDGKTYTSNDNIKVDKDMTFVAKFEDATTVNVNFYIDGKLIKTTKAVKGDYLYKAVELTNIYGSIPEDETRDFYHVWYSDPEFKNEVVFYDENGNSKEITEDTNVYTYFGTYYYISSELEGDDYWGFHDYGVVYSDEDKEKSTYGGDFLKTGKDTTTVYAEEKEGFEFVGWKLNHNDENYISTSKSYKFTVTQEHTEIFAFFRKKDDTHIVRFINDDEYGSRIYAVKDGEKVKELDNLYSFNKKIAGWYTDEELTAKYDFNTPVKGDLNLYAKWEKTDDIIFPVYFTVDNENYSIQYVAKGQKAEKPATPVKPNKLFKNWYGWGSSSSTSEAFDFDTPIWVGYDFYPEFGDAVFTKANIKVEQGTDNNAIITILNYTDTHKYVLETSTNNKKWTKVNVTNNDDKFVVKGLTYGKKVYYRVRAEAFDKKENSNVVNITPKPTKVTNLKVTSVGEKNVKLSWDKVNVTGYEVYMGKKKVATIKKAKTVTYNKKKLKANTKYKFKVRAYKTVKGKKVYGAWSEVVTTMTTPVKPKVSLSIKEYNEMNIKISKVKGANKYVVEKSLDGKAYTLVEELPTYGTLAQGDLEVGKTYYYRVKACNAYTCGKWTTVSKKQTTLAPKLSLATESKKVTVTVTAVNGADGYEVYRSTSKKKGYKLQGDTSDLLLENATKKGKTYYYKVRSYKLVDGKKVYSPYSGIKKIKSK